jgi:hypothetical protein
MTELADQHNARKARLQRFAEAAARYESKGRAPADIQSSAALVRCMATPALRIRREYETPNSQPIYAPITWRILRAVSDEFDMPVSDIISKRQEAEYTLPRYVVIGLILQLTNMSLPAIGRRIGGRDHTTVLNGRNRLAKLLESEAFRNRFDQIKAAVAA